MNTTLTIKTQKKLRDDAKKTAAHLGVPLTTIINAMLSQFVRERSVTLSVQEVPLQKKIDEWDRISDEADAGRGITGVYNTIDELFAHWDKVRAPKKRATR